MKINSDIIDTIKKSKCIALFCHTKPDGDALGSSYAMKYVLEKIGKECDIYCESKIPEHYCYISNYKCIKQTNDKNKKYDLAIALDCSDKKRMGECAKLFDKIPFSIKIDHHKTNEQFANLNQVEIVSSTCEVLYYVINQLGVELDDNIATCLYIGLASDTGCFMHDNTTSNTHEIASKLLEYNIDINKIHYYEFKRRTRAQLELLHICLGNLSFVLDDKVAFMHLKLTDFEKTGAEQSDTLGFVNYISNVDTTKVAVMLSEEKPNLFAVSFRTNGTVDVSKIAEIFGGGGHKMAAGAKIFGGITTVKKKITDVCKDFV